MQTVTAREIDEFDNPHGVSARRLLNASDVQVIYFELKPGEGLKTHTTPVDVFFYALEGTGTVEIGDESATIEADTLVESPAGIPHRLENAGEGPFRFLVVKRTAPGAGRHPSPPGERGRGSVPVPRGQEDGPWRALR